MNRASQINNSGFKLSALERITDYLSKQGQATQHINALTPDASTREYFRIKWQNKGAIACVYPEPIDVKTHSYLDATRLFREADLPVPETYDVDEQHGIIIQEDLGDTSLKDFLDSAMGDERDEYQAHAITLIAKIQATSEKARELNSITSRLAFDEEKLSWELNFFVEHYFKSLRGEDLNKEEFAELKEELSQVCVELAMRPRFLCHRDYHAMNLMVDRKNNLRIIDHQDSRMGPASYDLVSLLLDRQLASPSLSDIRAGRLFFLDQRRRFGLDAIDPDEFANEFRLMTIQRCLKATGTFSFQTAMRGRGELYLKFINPMLCIVKQAAEWLERFPKLRSMIKARLE